MALFTYCDGVKGPTAYLRQCPLLRSLKRLMRCSVLLYINTRLVAIAICLTMVYGMATPNMSAILFSALSMHGHLETVKHRPFCAERFRLHVCTLQCRRGEFS